MTTKELGILLKITADSAAGQAALQNIKKEIDGLSSGAETASTGWKASFQRMDQSVKDWSSSTQVQMGMAGALGAITAFVGASVTALATFENAMVGVQKTTGASTPEIEALGFALRDMAATQLPGTTAVELANIAQVAGQLGITGNDAILAFSKSIAEMSIATGLSAEEAATGMAQIEQIFKGGSAGLTVTAQAMDTTVAGLTANIGSSFNALENATTATTGELLNMTQRMGGAASTLGLSVDQVAAIAATLRDTGVQIEVGGTAMSKFFLDMVKNSDEWATALDLDAKAVADAMANDPMAAIDLVLQGMARLKAEEGPKALINTLEDLGVTDTRLTDAMLKLSDAQPQLANNLKISNQAFQEGTSLHGEAVVAASSTINQWKSLQEQSTELFRNFGAELKPATALLTQWASGGLTVVNDAAKAWRGGISDEFFDGVVADFTDLGTTVNNTMMGFAASIDNGVAALGRMGTALSNITQNDGITGFFEKFTDKIYGVEDALEGHSLTPALRRYIEVAMASAEETGGMSDAMQTAFQSALDADEAYQRVKQTITEKQNAVREYDIQIRTQQATLRAASDEEKDAIRQAIVDLQNKRSALQNEVSTLKNVQTEVKATADAEAAKAQEYKKDYDEVLKLQEKNIELTEEQRQQNIQLAGDQAITQLANQYMRASKAAGDYWIEADAAAREQERAAQAAQQLHEGLEGIGQDLQDVGQAFGISGLGQIGQGLGQLPDIFKGIKDSMSDLPGAFGQVKGGISGLFSGDILGGLSGLVGGFSGITGAIGALSQAWQIGKTVWSGIKSLFAETKSQGREAADALQAFVAENIEGGDELSQAMQQAYRDMGAAGGDFATFIQQTGTTLDATFGGLSANWQQGSTALDIFTQSLVAAGIEEDKAPQQALQMMAAFQDMGLSAEEAAAKMIEIAEASGMSTEEVDALRAALGGVTDDLAGTGDEGEQTGTVFDQASQRADALTGRIDDLSGSLDTVTDQMSNTGTETRDAGAIFDQAGIRAALLGGDMDALSQQLGLSAEEVEELRDMLLDLPDRRDIEINLTTNGQVPALAAGGGVGRTGLAIVNEAGFEAAKFPGGSFALLTTPGPVLGAFPVGTQILPHTQARQLAAQYPNLPRMATGGTITDTPTTIRDEKFVVNIYASVIDRGTIRMVETELNRLRGNRTRG